ncbi:XF1762 family protein [Paenibacillus sp. PDC88]|uniref:XF1762 family protein n=1 Tax=Paenibacillus provencensis TaxID=441151 RepID=A0ABW3QF63_9BACL|nr:XF1762 family protein [Paenibacillus sp. PDC88]SDX63258.1 hypothetical protein SAMN05518848_11091 [Paenibacillus sp. PDC88]
MVSAGPITDQFYWVFANNELERYIVLSVEELGSSHSLRWEMMNEGFHVLWDSSRSRKQAIRYMELYYPDYKKFESVPVPVTFREACDFVNKHHRHHPAPQGMKFALGLSNGRELIGVLIAGRPVSRLRDNRKTIEVTRLCVHSAYKNACSKLYASAARIAKEMGYQMLITYTLEEEDGGSLRGVGFQFIGVTPGGSWHSKSRSRQDRHPMGPKRAWSLNLSSSQEE